MEFARSIAQKAGEEGKASSSVCAADHDRSGGEEQAEPQNRSTSETPKSESMFSEQEDETECDASADLGSGVIEHGEGPSGKVTCDLDCKDSEVSKPDHDDNGTNECGNDLQDLVDNRTLSAEESGFSQEHHDHQTASLGTGEMLQDQSAAAISSSQNQRDSTDASAGASNSSQEQQHSTNSAVMAAQQQTESDEEAEFLAKIARFENPNGPPPLQLNYEALKHIATYFVPGSHGLCTDITKIWGGTFHEIRILTFEDGWTCIGRFAILPEPLSKTDSELATIAYVRKHTQIPVPEIYFVNHNENHVVGAAFVLMERIEGVRLFELWGDLSMEHRISVITQVARIVNELAGLQFDRIGSLTVDGTVGPLVNISRTEEETLAGPFNDFLEFVDATMDETRRHDSEEVLAIYPATRDGLRKFLATGNMDPMLQAPYRLIHVDLEDRNIMVTRESERHPPKISGVIDWDHAFVGPAYYLYGHITVTNDLQKEKEELPGLKKLRQHFVKALVQHHPRNSPERDLIKQCFRENSVELTKLLSFAKFPLDSDSFSSMIKTYLASFDHDNELGDRHPYDVFHTPWVPDSDLESDGCATATEYLQDQAKGACFEHKLTGSSDHEAQSDKPVQDAVSETRATVDSWREDETPPLDLNYEALKHIASTCLSHGDCIDITSLRRGGFHEIRVLHFEDGWSCIARFTRNYEMLCKTESELATIAYVRKHTSIPVPEIYLVNHNENHVVGAPFVLMERLEGQPLCNIWAELTLEHKKSVIGQLSHVLGQLAELKFDDIGSLIADGTLGPPLNITEPENAVGETPFKSRIDFFHAFLKEDQPARTSAAKKHYRAIREELKSFMDENADNPTLNAPYRLIHNDLDSQNILVTQEDKTLPPKISGIIDWDWSYTGPLYYLCEYPHNICDWDDAPEDYADNKILRKHLVATLIDYFPENSPERKHIKQCFREKSYILNYFQSLFMTRVWPVSMEGSLVEQYLNKMRGGGSDWERLPYSGTFDWKRDSDLSDSDLEDLEDEESQSEDESVYDEDSGDYSKEESSVEASADMDLQSLNAPPPLNINYEALKHVATYFLPVTHGACIDIKSIDGGRFHKVKLLTFADGWTCIGRFAREEERLYKTESELATMEYVRTRTKIPINHFLVIIERFAHPSLMMTTLINLSIAKLLSETD